jgi:cell wall-associated NlpC family hydrolase
MRFGLFCTFVAMVLLLAFPAGAVAEPARAAANPRLVPAPAEPDSAEAVGRPRVVEIALQYLGTPYRWAGASPSGFDCSGFVMYVYGEIGIALPHNGAQLWGRGRFVPRDRLEPGDVVFFNGLGHVGIYIGRGRFVHSPQTGDVVKVSRVSYGWYRSTYVGARRYG